MAKNLPYFKFFCSEWNDGDITLETYEIQGLFINVCSYFWSKECEVTKKLLYKRFRRETDNIDYLVREGLIKFNNEHLSINFLEEQFSEIEATSKAKSAAGIKSAKIKKLRKQINELCKDFSIEFKVDLTQLQQEFNTDSTDVDFLLKHISTIKIRRDKKRLEKEDIKEDVDAQTDTKPEYIKPEDVYSEKDFLGNWKKCREGYMKQVTIIPKLDFHERNDFKEVVKEFTKEQINTALHGLFKQENKNISSMYLRPKHFLKYVSKYLNAELNKDYELYGKDQSQTKKGGL